MDTSPTTIKGTDLVGDAAALQWYEALAVFLQMTETIKQIGVTCVPDLGRIQLSTDGTVAFLPRVVRRAGTAAGSCLEAAAAVSTRPTGPCPGGRASGRRAI